MRRKSAEIFVDTLIPTGWACDVVCSIGNESASVDTLIPTGWAYERKHIVMAMRRVDTVIPNGWAYEMSSRNGDHGSAALF